MTVFTLVLDTNIVFQQLLVRTAPWELLTSRARKGEITVVIPELVWLELRTLAHEKLAEARAAWDAATEKLRRYQVEPPPWPSAEAVTNEKALVLVSRLREEFTEAGGEAPDLPAVDHERVVRRALARRRPFDPAGKDGYRDALLWENVLALLGEGRRVVLVSNDAAAFAASNDSEKLHPALRDEAATHATGTGTLELVRSLGKAAELVSGRVEETRAMVARVLEGDLVAEIIQSVAEEAREGAELSRTQLRRLGWAPAVIAARVEDIEDIGGIDVVSAVRLDDDRVLVEVEIGYGAVLGLRLDDYLDDEALYEPLFTESNFEHEGLDFWGTGHGAVRRAVSVYAEIVVSGEPEAIESVRVLRVTVPGPPGRPSPEQLRLNLF